MADEVIEEAPVEEAAVEEAAVEEKASEEPVVEAKAEALDWRSAITQDDLRKHAERFNSLDDVFKGNLEMRQKLSNAIVKPGKNATADDISAYNRAIGMPDNAEAYVYTPPKDRVDAFSTPESQERVSEFKKFAFENGVPAEKFPKFIDWYNKLTDDNQNAVIEADKKNADATEAALKKQWGRDYDANKEIANRGAMEVFGPDFEAFRQMETKDGRFIGDHPTIVAAMAKIGRMMSEDGLGPVPMSADASADMRVKLEELTSQQMDAQRQGNDRKAKQLDGEIMKLASRMSGDREYAGPNA